MSTSPYDRMTAAEILEGAKANRDGLSTTEARLRLKRDGPNEITAQKTSVVLQILRLFWGPIAWMIEIAVALSIALQRWTDAIVIGALLLINAAVRFWEEYRAGNAVAQLRKDVALMALILRDGHWQRSPARELVIGDVIRLRLGDVIPADARLLSGDYLRVDQSALTGESLPVDKGVGDLVLSGSVAKQGEMTAVVTATGPKTFMGHTASLVAGVSHRSRLQTAMVSVGHYLILLTAIMIAVLFAVGFARSTPWLQMVQFALILAVASVPVAMPAVLSVTMAVGALMLSKMRAVVARLDSIEAMAGVDVLCCDKTGTLTQNRLSLGEPIPAEGITSDELIKLAKLTCEREDPDAIDQAILGAASDGDQGSRRQQIHLIPFDPVRKRAEATIQDENGRSFKVVKGAPQVVLDLVAPAGSPERSRMEDRVHELAHRGFRALAVAQSDDGVRWQLLGILPLLDPPRPDAKQAVAAATRHGLRVKLVTGDHAAIGREIAHELGMGGAIWPATALSRDDPAKRLGDLVEEADGFAEVLPEDKYDIVDQLQSAGHVVAMTGDGVNDAPALERADVGIAVHGATDAARAAADLVLTSPGLGVIARAIEESRRIFERMHSYALYRVTETLRIVIFFGVAMVAFGFYPLSAMMVVLLALLNDLPIMAVAYDNTPLDEKPAVWDMGRVLTVATALGLIGVIETLLLVGVVRYVFRWSVPELQSLVFLKLVVAGHLTLLVTRSKKSALARPWPSPKLLAAIVATQAVAVAIVALGIGVAALSPAAIAMLWGYCLVWVVIEDRAKLAVYRNMEKIQTQERRVVDVARRLSRLAIGHGRWGVFKTKARKEMT